MHATITSVFFMIFLNCFFSGLPTYSELCLTANFLLFYTTNKSFDKFKFK